MNHAALLALVLTLPRAVTPEGYGSETPEAYRSRLEVISMANVGVSRTVEEAAAVTAQEYGESRFDLLIHAGLPHPRWHEDHGRAACLSQLWPSAIVPSRPELVGTGLEATKRCALATLRVIRSAAFMCTQGSMLTQDDMERVFAMVGSGHSCAPTVGSRQRARMWARIRDGLYRG